MRTYTVWNTNAAKHVDISGWINVVNYMLVPIDYTWYTNVSMNRLTVYGGATDHYIVEVHMGGYILIQKWRVEQARWVTITLKDLIDTNW